MSRYASCRFLRATALAAVALAGCAGVGADWVKPGATETQVRADNATCRAEAEDVYGTTARITHDIQVSRPRGVLDVDRQSQQIRSYETERSYDKVFGVCMAARGYSKREAGR